MPRGYHPVVNGAVGLYYLNVMAGPVREWRIGATRLREPRPLGTLGSAQ